MNRKFYLIFKNSFEPDPEHTPQWVFSLCIIKNKSLKPTKDIFAIYSSLIQVLELGQMKITDLKEPGMLDQNNKSKKNYFVRFFRKFEAEINMYSKCQTRASVKMYFLFALFQNISKRLRNKKSF